MDEDQKATRSETSYTYIFALSLIFGQWIIPKHTTLLLLYTARVVRYVARSSILYQVALIGFFSWQIFHFCFYLIYYRRPSFLFPS